MEQPMPASMDMKQRPSATPPEKSPPMQCLDNQSLMMKITRKAEKFFLQMHLPRAVFTQGQLRRDVKNKICLHLQNKGIHVTKEIKKLLNTQYNVGSHETEVFKRRQPHRTFILFRLNIDVSVIDIATMYEEYKVTGTPIYAALNQHTENLYKTNSLSPTTRHYILHIITTKFMGQCGIIYCVSRKEVETLEQYLSAYGLSTT